MKKKAAKKSVSKKKGFLRSAGEVLGSIGHELVEGKDKIVEMSHTVIEGITKSISPSSKKTAVKKVAPKKAAKKAIKKPTPKKAAKVPAKKTAAKKAAKK